MPDYRAILRQTLQKMFEEGKPSVPTAYEVLQSWRVKFTDKPQSAEEYPKIYVHDHYFKYENKDGLAKTISIKTLKAAIYRLITS